MDREVLERTRHGDSIPGVFANSAKSKGTGIPGNDLVWYSWCFKHYGGPIALYMRISINRIQRKLETDIFVKPTNAQLYLHYRSNHPRHVFKGIVYSQSLRILMICSRPKWRDRALANLRQKFLNQDYPTQMIDFQFQRVLLLNRADLIFRVSNNKKKNKKFKCCMVMTHHNYNPPMAQWIQEELPILHLSKNVNNYFQQFQ